MNQSIVKLFFLTIFLPLQTLTIQQAAQSELYAELADNSFLDDLFITKSDAVKTFCKLFATSAIIKNLRVCSLTVDNTLIVDGTSMTPLTPSAALTEYGYIYKTATQNVASNASITFEFNGILTPGITHTPGSDSITIVTAGIYEINFIVLMRTADVTQAGTVALFANGIPVGQAVYGATVGQISGQVLLQLAAGTVLTIHNVATTQMVVDPALAGPATQPTVSASIIIERIA